MSDLGHDLQNQPGNQPSGDAQPKPEDKSAENGTEKTFTQEDLTRVATANEDKGKRQALKELAQELGMPIDKVKELVQQDADRKEQAKSDLQKANERAEAAEKAKEDAERKAQEDAYPDRVKLRLIKAKLPESVIDDDESLDLVMGLVRQKAPVGSSVEDIDTAIEAVKAKLPSLFEVASDDGGSKRVQHGNVPSNPSGTPGSTSLGATGEEKASNRVDEWMNRTRRNRKST